MDGYQGLECMTARGVIPMEYNVNDCSRVVQCGSSGSESGGMLL